MSNLEKALKLLENKDFLEKLSAVKDKAAAIALFKDNGAPINDKDFETICAVIKAAASEDGEIPDELAEQVAGGAFDPVKFFNTLGGMITSLGGIIGSFMDLINGGGSDTQSGGSSSDTQSGGKS